MLGKIQNISAEFSGSGNNKGRNSHFLNSGFDERSTERKSSDSLQLSPAALFFLRLNIFLKEFSQDEKDEYSLRFNVGKYQISTTVNTGSGTPNEYQLYSISDYEKLNSQFKKLTVDMLVDPGLIIELEGSRPFVLEYFDTIFGRIKNLNIMHPLSRSESYAISVLLDGFYDDFVKEISKINTAVFSFIDKQNGSTLAIDLPNIRIIEPRIVIEKISTNTL